VQGPGDKRKLIPPTMKQQTLIPALTAVLILLAVGGYFWLRTYRHREVLSLDGDSLWLEHEANSTI